MGSGAAVGSGAVVGSESIDEDSPQETNTDNNNNKLTLIIKNRFKSSSKIKTV